MTDGRPSAQADQADHRRSVLRVLSAPGGGLSLASPKASVRNPDWFPQGEHGAPAPARSLTHRKILNRYFAERPDVARERRAVLMAGPPGAGKSSTLTMLLTEWGESPETWRVVENDDFKSRLFRQALDDGSYDTWFRPRDHDATGIRVDPLEMSDLVHRESSILTSAALGEAVDLGENLVLDGTLSNPDKAVALARRLERAGYGITVVDVEADLATTLARVDHRWLQGHLEAEAARARGGTGVALGGRTVPEQACRELYPDDPAMSCCWASAQHVVREVPAARDLLRFRTPRPDAAPAPDGRWTRTAAGSLVPQHLSAVDMMRRTTFGGAPGRSGPAPQPSPPQPPGHRPSERPDRRPDERPGERPGRAR